MIEILKQNYPDKLFEIKIASFGNNNYRELWCDNKKILIWNINIAEENVLIERANDEIKKININDTTTI